jgi:hypothetical protein
MGWTTGYVPASKFFEKKIEPEKKIRKKNKKKEKSEILLGLIYFEKGICVGLQGQAHTCGAFLY